MSPAEQKRRKREEKARRDLLAQLLKKYRSMELSPYARNKKHQAAADTAAAKIKQQRTHFFDELRSLPVFELKRLLETWNTASDRHGRLHNERSGEAPRKNGQSEIEVIKEQQRIFDEGGRKVKPQGHGPAKDKDDATEDDQDLGTTDNVRRQHRSKEAALEERQSFDNKMYLVARWMMKDGACSICGSTDGEDHIWKKWYECEGRINQFQALHAVSPDVAGVLYGQIDHEHIDKIDELLRKRWVFFASVDDRTSTHGDVTAIKIPDLIKRGWSFFSTVSDRTEYLLPSQSTVRIFFGQW
jgi:hypothetical protein